MILLPVVLLAGASIDGALLMRHAPAAGLDGYYYVLQVESLRDSGHLHYPTRAPLILYLVAGLASLTGDTVLSLKVGSVFFHALLTAGVFALINHVTRSAFYAALGAALSAFLPLHLYMVSEYVKNLGAVALLVWGCYFALRAKRAPRKTWLAASLVTLTLAFLSHRSALPTAAVFTSLLLMAKVLAAGRAGARLRVPAVGAAAVVWCLPALAATQAFAGLPEWLRLELSPVPKWPFPSTGFAEGVILLILAPLSLFLISRQGVKVDSVVGAVALWGLLFTLNPFLNSDPELLTISGRLNHLIYLQVAILLPCALWLTSVVKRNTLTILGALLAGLLILSLRAPLPRGLRSDFMGRRSSLLEGAKAPLPISDERPLIIAPHGDQFVVEYASGLPSQHHVPARPEGRKLYWLMSHYDRRLTSPSTVILFLEGGRFCTVLIEDGELRRLIEAVGENERSRLLSANPHFRRAHHHLN